jgi:hypothetical protein
MPQELDVYRDWLGIADTDRPLNYYQLLRLSKFEDDTEKIRANYRKLNAQVRKYAAGQYGQRSQELLNELARAMLCLTDATRKAEYDASLGRREEAKLGRTLEEILIRRKVVDSAQLGKARNYANAVGVEIREALVQQKLAPQDVVMQAYAESVGVPFIDLDDIQIDEELVPQVPALMARQHSCAPLLMDDGVLLMASPNLLTPEVEEELRLRLGAPVRTVLCTPAQIHAVVDKHFPKEAADAELARGGAAKAGGKQAAKGTATRGAKTAAKGSSAKVDAAAAKSETGGEDGDPATAYTAPQVEAEVEDPKVKQQRQLIAAIVGGGMFVLVAVVLNFWSPYRSEQLGIGPLGFATAGGIGLLTSLVAYPFVGGKK